MPTGPETTLLENDPEVSCTLNWQAYTIEGLKVYFFHQGLLYGKGGTFIVCDHKLSYFFYSKTLSTQINKYIAKLLPEVVEGPYNINLGMGPRGNFQCF